MVIKTKQMKNDCIAQTLLLKIWVSEPETEKALFVNKSNDILTIV